MKKIMALLAVLAIIAVAIPSVSATDICSPDPLTVRNFNAEITTAVHLRDISCMDSNVITTLSTGEVVQVVGTTEGWHKIKRADGTEGWIWETFLSSTDKSFNLSSEPEPEPEPTLYVEPEPVVYEAMRDIGGHKYENAIWYVYNNGIVQGYEDGSYKPDQKINRAELLKIVVESKYGDEFNNYDGAKCFADINSSEWYAKYVCFAKQEGIVEGYGDGTFKPADEINFAEALKIVLIGMGYEYSVGEPWYRPIVETASDNNIIPLDINKFDDKLNRAQMAEMITRMLKFQGGELEDYLGAMADSKITYEMLEY